MALLVRLQTLKKLEGELFFAQLYNASKNIKIVSSNTRIQVVRKKMQELSVNFLLVLVVS